MEHDRGRGETALVSDTCVPNATPLTGLTPPPHRAVEKGYSWHWFILAHKEGHMELFLFGRANDELICKLPCSIMPVKREETGEGTSVPTVGPGRSAKDERLPVRRQLPVRRPDLSL